MSWAAVLGAPIAHSLSPVLHRAAYASLGLDWTYDARWCDAAGLPAALALARGDPSFAGYSLTMPLKEAVLPLLDVVSSPVPAVNTVLPVDGGLVGRNSDVEGVRAAVLGLPAGDGSAAVLGAGGTAKAAVAALLGLGRRVAVVARRPAASQGGPGAPGAPGAPGVPVVGWEAFTPSAYSLVVACVPAGVTDVLAARGWPASCALVDVLYEPWPTALGAAALRAGAPVAGGREVLVAQAVAQVEWMTGRIVSSSVLVGALQSLG